MVRHYLDIILARLGRSPVATLANILTLALGLIGIIIAWGIVSWWRSSDAGIAPSDRTYVISQRLEVGAQDSGVLTVTSAHIAKYIREDIPEAETVARLRRMGNIPADTGDRALFLKGAQVEPDFLKIFRLNFLAGDPATAMQRESGVILTDAAAKRLFGNAPAIGRRLVLAKQREVFVTGVLAPISAPSHLLTGSGETSFDYLSTFRESASGDPEMWLSVGIDTYAVLPANGSLQQVQFERRLAQMVERRMPADQKSFGKVTLGAIPLAQLSERRLDNVLFTGLAGTLSVVHVLFGLGILVLGIACLNYANLATAQAVARAKEVGMRKVLGAGRFGIFIQCWIEAGVLTLAAFVVAGLAVWLASPVLAAQTDINIAAALVRTPWSIVAGAVLLLCVSLAAGLCPAVMISRVHPAEALRSGRRRGGRGLAQALVGLQFAAASLLLIAVMVINQQNAYMRSLAIDGAADPVVTLNSASLTGITNETLRGALAGYPQVKAVGEMDHVPWSDYQNGMALTRSLSAAASSKTGSMIGVGFGYFEAMGTKVLAGRVYDQARDQGARSRLPGASAPRDASRTTEPLVIDRAYAEQLGFASPQAAIEQLIYVPEQIIRLAGPQPPLEIIGVVENQPQHLQTSAGRGNIYGLDSGAVAYVPLIRLDRNQLDAGLAALERVHNQLAPGVPFTYTFVDELFERSYHAFERVGRLFQALSLLAFLISAMGLFGMAVHVTQQRRHEIGVRKTLGSTAVRVVALLLRNFSKPVIVANVLAWPVAWYAAQAYLNPFMQRVELGLPPFLFSLAITLGIAWVTVGGQTLRAATVRPAEVLRRT